MLTSDTKRHIDAARQVLVGVVPNPSSQIDQITNALIYKFMDDMDQASMRVKGGKAMFFIGDLEPYAWTRLMDASLGNQARMNLYVEALSKFGEAKQLPPLFRDIYKRAFLPFRDPETLGLFLKEIAYFDYTHSEELGNAYEYLLSIMGSQGDAGQFRTPRHIIDFIVAAVDPEKGDTILDPACGTAGFLISAYKHILAKHDGKDEKGKPNKETPLTPDERKKLMEHFEGYDVDPTMVRVSQVNMYLHAFKNPKIFEYNTLASEDRWNDKHDIILANPPFMSPKGGVRPHKRFSVESTRAEVLFVDYIMNHLKPRGRAGVIVPEGVIFQSGTAYKQLRKNLVEDGLYAVVSLPAGVFNPYAGVKTSILLFDRELAKRATEILFIKVANDGYDLGAQRREHAHNDLPQALEVLHKWKSGKKSESQLALYVEKAKLAETGDYNLSGDRYRVGTDYSNSKWPIVELGEVCEVTAGQSPEGKYYNDHAEGMPFYQGKTEFTEKYIGEPKKWTTNITKTAEKNDILMSVRAPVGPVNLATQRICIGRGLASIRPKEVMGSYIFSLLKSMENSIVGNGGAVFDSINKSDIEKIKIPIPPLEVQQQIVTELDGYAGIIAGARQIVDSWKPKIDIAPEWKWVEIKDVATKEKNAIKAGPFGSALKKEIYTKSGYKIYGQEQVIKGDINYGDYYISEQTYRELESCSIKAGDILISLVGTYGKLLVVPDVFKPGIINPRLMKITLDAGKCSPKYFKTIFESDVIKNIVDSMSYGGTMGILNTTILRNIEIPLPPLDAQKQIVEKIEAERTLVESAKKLIAIYEQKTKETIAKLWSK